MTPGRRIHAARYLRTLATIEHLSAVGNESEVRRLLAGIDPIEACELAAEVESDGDGAQVIPFGNPSVIDAWRETYPHVIHAEDNWSRKVGA